jgi:hypothetical protein
MGVSCTKVAFATADGSTIVEAIHFKTASQIYDPQLNIVEVGVPVSLTVGGSATISLKHQGARASIRTNSGLAERISLLIKSPELGGLQSPISAQSFELHGRKGQANQIDLASKIIAIKAGNAPQAEVTFDAFIAGASRIEAALQRQGDIRTALRNLTLSFANQASLKISGPFSFDDFGLMNGNITIAVENGAALGPALMQVLSTIGVDTAATTNLFASAGNSSLTVTIRQGKASIGFIPLGKIPPL